MINDSIVKELAPPYLKDVLQSEFKVELIKKHYCFRYPKVSERLLKERYEQAIVVSLLRELDSVVSESDIREKLKDIKNKAIDSVETTSLFDGLFADLEVLRDFKEDILGFVSKVGRQGLLLPFYLSISRYSKLKRFHQELLNSGLIENCEFRHFSSNFIDTDPLDLTVNELIERHKNATPIIWTGKKNALAYFLSELHKKLEDQNLGKYEVAVGLILIKHEKGYDLTNLDGSNNPVTAKMGNKINLILSAF